MTRFDYRTDYLPGMAMTGAERDSEAFADRYPWRNTVTGQRLLSPADMESDWDGTDWDEHYAWQAHETFSEVHPEDL